MVGGRGRGEEGDNRRSEGKRERKRDGIANRREEEEEEEEEEPIVKDIRCISHVEDLCWCSLSKAQNCTIIHFDECWLNRFAVPHRCKVDISHGKSLFIL